MITSIKKIRKYKVFCHNCTEPWGTVKDIFINNGSGNTNKILVDTISLIPISRSVNMCDIDFISDDSVYLKTSTAPGNKPRPDTTETDKIQHVNFGGRLYSLRDMSFDFETGTITEIVISRNKLAKKTKIPINKITVRDNTIYVEEKGGNKNG